MFRKLTYIMTVVSLLHLYGCGDETSANGPEGQSSGAAANSSVIYEANPRLFAERESLKAIEGRLDDILDLGADILWLMPIYEQGSLKAIGSPYCVRDYEAVNPDYGTLEDLQSLVATAHDKGMKVILDWVANHTSWDNDWISAHKEWYTQDAGGNIISPAGMGWTDVADLNFDNAEMRRAMIDAMRYWIRQADVDGFRCDYAEGVPLDFWQEAIGSLRSEKSDLLMLAEGGESQLYEAGFDLVYGWSFASELEQVFKGSASAGDLFNTHLDEYRGIPAGKLRMRYSTNHDLASTASPITTYGDRDAALTAFVIATMLPGVPMVYSSQEIAYPQALSFFNNNVLNWDSEPEYRARYKAILAAYRQTAQVRGGTLKSYSMTGAMAFSYETPDGAMLLVIASLSDQPQSVKTPMERVGDRLTDLIDGQQVTLSTVLELDPYQYLILKK